MKKATNRIAITVMVLVLLMALCACGEKKTEIANPVHETDAAGLTEITGITLDAPEGAEDTAYSYIEATADESAVAQVTFSLDGKAYTYRAASTQETEMIETLDSGIQKGAALAGLNFDSWDRAGTVEVSYCEGVYAHTPEKASFIAWIDKAPGFMYCMTAEDEVTQEVLTKTVEKAFVPMQGDDR